MLKKLRIKFIALNMATVAVVLTVIFAAICGLMGLFPNGVLSVMQSIAGAIA